MIVRSAIVSLLFLALVACEPKGSSTAPIALPDSAVNKLKGTGGIADGGRAFADIYNGTEWTIVDVDFSVTKVPTGESRTVRLTCFQEVEEPIKGKAFTRKNKVSMELQPFSSGSFEGSGGDFVDGLTKAEISYSFKGARGYKR